MAKWYSKATVQAALVNNSVSIILVIVSLLSLYFTVQYRDTTMKSEHESKKIENRRDSLTYELQKELLERQLEFQAKAYRLDSIQTDQQIKLLAGQNQLNRNRQFKEERAYQSELVVSKEDFITAIQNAYLSMISDGGRAKVRLSMAQYDLIFTNLEERLKPLTTNSYLRSNKQFVDDFNDLRKSAQLFKVAFRNKTEEEYPYDDVKKIISELVDSIEDLYRRLTNQNEDKGYVKLN